jgi:large subunit GTPase 1
VLPIDQLREYSGPVTLVTRRIPKPFLEAIYGIQIKMRPIEEGGTGVPTAEELLMAYARHRGFMTQGQGQPDQSRAARYVLKDYVNGKLLYCEPPPGDIDGKEFNAELYDAAHLPEKRQEAFNAAMEAVALEEAELDDDASLAEFVALPQGAKSQKLDKAFFKPGSRNAGHLSMPFNHRYTEQGKVAIGNGKPLSSRKMRMMLAMEQGVDPKDVQLMGGKKHFKGGKNPKKKLRAANKQGDDD